MSLQFSYRIIAPVYDAIVERPLRGARERSLARLQAGAGQRILVSGIGTGLDIPFLPPGARYAGLDLTAAMLARARQRAGNCDIQFIRGDSCVLPFADAVFDSVVLHLILAIVPDSAQALRESARVVKAGGRLLVLDKFLRPGQRALLRRWLSPLTARIATRLDVVFEDTLARVSGLRVISDQPALASDWIRSIELEKFAS